MMKSEAPDSSTGRSKASNCRRSSWEVNSSSFSIDFKHFRKASQSRRLNSAFSSSASRVVATLCCSSSKWPTKRMETFSASKAASAPSKSLPGKFWAKWSKCCAIKATRSYFRESEDFDTLLRRLQLFVLRQEAMNHGTVVLFLKARPRHEH